MTAAAGRRWWKPGWLGVLLAGAALMALGLRSAGDWVGRGTLVGSADEHVPGAPPWQIDLLVPEVGRTYLLEVTVRVAAPATRERLTMRPELRLHGPDEQRADQALELAGPARTVTGTGTATLTAHWWLRPLAAGEHRLELVSLGLSGDRLTPRGWGYRLAADVPNRPSGRALPVVGFALAAAALAMLVLPAPPRQTGSGSAA